MIYLSCILMCFEATSRFKVNMEKSAILPIGDVESIEQLEIEFGCRVGTPFHQPT